MKLKAADSHRSFPHSLLMAEVQRATCCFHRQHTMLVCSRLVELQLIGWCAGGSATAQSWLSIDLQRLKNGGGLFQHRRELQWGLDRKARGVVAWRGCSRAPGVSRLPLIVFTRLHRMSLANNLANVAVLVPVRWWVVTLILDAEVWCDIDECFVSADGVITHSLSHCTLARVTLNWRSTGRGSVLLVNHVNFTRLRLWFHWVHHFDLVIHLVILALLSDRKYFLFTLAPAFNTLHVYDAVQRGRFILLGIILDWMKLIVGNFIDTKLPAFRFKSSSEDDGTARQSILDCWTSSLELIV